MAVVVGLCVLNLTLPGSRSLKEKRRRIKSIKDRVQNKFSLSIAEVNQDDNWQITQLAIAGVASEKAYLQRIIAQAVKLVETEPEIIITDYRIDFW
jgi:hypothetical protein